MTIADLHENQIGKISIENTSGLPLKLLELGCLDNAEVEVIKKMVNNDPIYIRVNDSFIAIRKDLANKITIRTEEEVMI